MPPLKSGLEITIESVLDSPRLNPKMISYRVDGAENMMVLSSMTVLGLRIS